MTDWVTELGMDWTDCDWVGLLERLLVNLHEPGTIFQTVGCLTCRDVCHVVGVCGTTMAPLGGGARSLDEALLSSNEHLLIQDYLNPIRPGLTWVCEDEEERMDERENLSILVAQVTTALSATPMHERKMELLIISTQGDCKRGGPTREMTRETRETDTSYPRGPPESYHQTPGHHHTPTSASTLDQWPTGAASATSARLPQQP